MSKKKGQKAKIFISRPDIPQPALDLLKGCDLDIWDQETTVPRDVFLRKIAGKDALFIYNGDIIDKAALDAAGDNLKVIGTLSAGYDHINVEEAKKKGIRLGYTPGVLNDAVAELTVGLILTTTRRLIEARNTIIEGTWNSWVRWNWMNGFALKNSVIGIFGMGRIGLEIARRLVAFKPLRILYVSRSEKPEAAEMNAVRVGLEELLKESDVLVVAVSLSDETRGIIDGDKLGLMKMTAIIVNISRGEVINQEALVKALKDKKIGGAALDVMTPEPLPANHELLGFPNCSLTPHIGSADYSTRIAMAEVTSRNILAGLTGNPLPAEI